MKRVLCATAVVIAAIAIDHCPAQASGGAWCVVYNEDAAYLDCHYRSFEECYAHLGATNRGSCNLNPGYQGAEQPARKPPARRSVRD